MLFLLLSLFTAASATASNEALASLFDLELAVASAECDVWSENGSCRGSAFGTSCINDQHVTGSCVPYGEKNWSGNYRCRCF